MDVNSFLLLPFIVIQIILAIVAIIDCGEIEKTNGPKLMWFLIIIIINIIGPTLYFIFGRKDFA